jgi:hypothetical protein
MRKKLAYKASVCALLSAMAIGQTMTAYAAVSAAAVQGNWQYENQEWKHYDLSGNMSTGWIKKDSGWYYLQPETGKMLTGWQVIDGKKYYLNSAQEGVEGSMHTGWKQDQNGNWYFLCEDTNGSPAGALTGWNWIDGYCYYFGDGDEHGVMYAGRETPDGYLTDEQGCWADEDGNAYYEEGKGIITSAGSTAVGGTASVGGGSSSGGGSGSGGSSGSSSSSGSGSNSGSSSNSGSGSSSNSGSTGSNSAANAGSNNSVDGTSGSTPDSNHGSDNSVDGTSGSTPGSNHGGSDSVDGTSGSTPGSNHGSDNSVDGTSGSTPGSNHGNGGSEDTVDGEQNENQSTFMDEQKTKLVDIGWAQYAVVTFLYGTVDDYRIEVDGTDITSACTKVDDAGTVVKWEVTAWNPGEITAIRTSDKQEHTLKLSSGSASGEIQVRSGESAPAYIMTNGPVDSFDFYLDNYDKDGNVRTKPAYTTFSIYGSRTENTAAVPYGYYIPDTLIDEDGNGEITIKLALATDEQAQWFQGLSQIKALDTNNDILNSKVAFSTSVVEDEPYHSFADELLCPRTLSVESDFFLQQRDEECSGTFGG